MRQERIFLREIFALNPGLDFHREGAQHAKKTRRTPSVGSVRRRVPQPVLSKKIRCCLCEKE
ncbi:MAG: hypothetical protein DMG09_11130 [Acidobacteria bacterium]|nr:MAG: hypothetical protein DMG09_11130 [Acidobacteriota bacterium]